MTHVNTTQAADTTSAVKGARPLFYTRKDHKGAPVSIWLGTKTADRAPKLEGTIGDIRVAGFIQQGPKGPFVSFVDSTKGKDAETGFYTQVATARVVVKDTAVKSLVIKAEGVADNWAEVSLDATQDFLVSIGLNLDKLDQKQAAVALKKAAQPQKAVATEEAVPA